MPPTPPRRKAVVVLSGDAPPRDVLAECAGALVVAADGGGNHLDAWGLVPDVVVGDMDSIRPEVLARFEAAGARIHRYPGAKDDTDGALAVDEAIRGGAEDILLAGATGGRLDHTLANFHLLRRGAERGVRMRAASDEGRLWTVTPPHPLELALPAGATLSVLPLTDVAEGVTVEGCAWPLRQARLATGDPIGVSNEAREPTQRVSCSSGVLAVIEPRHA